MTYRIRILAAVAATVAGSLFAAPSAQAAHEDTSECVAPIESKSLQGFFNNGHAATRASVEAHWEVTGRGHTALPMFDDVVRYTRCGYDLDVSFVFVYYVNGIVVTWGQANTNLRCRP